MAPVFSVVVPLLNRWAPQRVDGLHSSGAGSSVHLTHLGQGAVTAGLGGASDPQIGLCWSLAFA